MNKHVETLLAALAIIENYERDSIEFAIAKSQLNSLIARIESSTNKPGTNTGHGHVWARPDGRKARCGGPLLCKECKRDYERYKDFLIDL